MVVPSTEQKSNTALRQLTAEPATAMRAAHAYAALGWRVVPIKPGAKHPGVEAWQNAATTDRRTIDGWWAARYLGHGVGIATGPGSGVWVLDVDVSDGKGGNESLAALAAEHGPLPVTVVAQTGSGGWHYFFAWREDREPVRNRQGAGQIGNGLDVRGDGGQVVAAPTLHPTTQQPYRWVEGCAPWDIPVAPAPDWLHDLLERPAAQATAPISYPMQPSAPGRRSLAPSKSSAFEDSAAEYAKSKHDLRELLPLDGWLLDKVVGDEHRFVRPGKDPRHGSSANVHQAGDVLMLFSTDASLSHLHAAGKPAKNGTGSKLSTFDYLVATRFGGDRSACASHFRREMNSSTIQSAPVAPAAGAETPPTPWDEPLPIGAPVPPSFPVETLPRWVADFVADVAFTTQTPVDLASILVLGATSTIALGRVVVDVADGWSEHVNPWLAVGMASGDSKSPTVKAVFDPVQRQLEPDLRRKSRKAITEAKVRRSTLEAQRLKAEKAGDVAELTRITLELEELVVPSEPQLVTDDYTPEAFTELLSQQGAIAVVSAEGGPLGENLSRYASSADQAQIDPYLKAHAGDPIVVNRKGRPRLDIPQALATFVLAVQPTVLRKAASNREFVDRGLVPRFMFSLPPSNVGSRDFTELRHADQAKRAAWERFIVDRGSALHGWQSPKRLRVDADAGRLFSRWRQSLEARRVPGGDLAHAAAWSAKLEASVLRVTGLLWVLDDDGTVPSISAEIMARAIVIGNYWIEHAAAMFDLIGADESLVLARRALGYIRAEGWASLTATDLIRKNARAFPDAATARVALERLREAGWVRIEDPGGKRYAVWPGAHSQRPTIGDGNHANHADPEKCA